MEFVHFSSCNSEWWVCLREAGLHMTAGRRGLLFTSSLTVPTSGLGKCSSEYSISSLLALRGNVIVRVFQFLPHCPHFRPREMLLSGYRIQLSHFWTMGKSYRQDIPLPPALSPLPATWNVIARVFNFLTFGLCRKVTVRIFHFLPFCLSLPCGNISPSLLIPHCSLMSTVCHVTAIFQPAFTGHPSMHVYYIYVIRYW